MIRHTALGVVWLMVCAPAWSQDQPALPADTAGRVGKLGKPDALVLTGVKHFPESQLRDALAKDFDVVLAGHAQEKLDGYLKILERRLKEGYLVNGFPHVAVSATAVPKRHQIAVKVTEGEKFCKGEVQVECPKEIDPKVLVRFATDASFSSKSRAEKNSFQASELVHATVVTPSWVKGDQLNFFQKPAEQFREVIEAGLAAQGHFFPEYDAQLKPGKDGKADLWIKVTDPGPKAVIGQIRVLGLKHHTPEQILKLLDLKPGMPVDYGKKTACEKKLQDSHCFLESRIAVLPAIAPGAPSDVEIHLVEQPEGPYLGETLTEHDRLFAKTAEWMTNWQKGSQSDFVILGKLAEPKAHLLLISSPNQGAIAELELAVPNQPKPLRYTFITSKEGQRLVCWHSRRVLRVAWDTAQVCSFYRFKYKPQDSNPSQWALDLQFGLGVNSQRGKLDNPLSLDVKMTPAVAIATGRHPQNSIQEKDGVVSVERDGLLVRVSQKTGELLSISENPLDWDALTAAAVPRMKDEGTVQYFQAGAFQKYMEELDRETKDIPSANNPQRPVSSVVELVLHELELMNHLAKTDAPVGVFARLIELDAISPLDRLWIDWQARPYQKGNFWLPWNSEEDRFQLFGLEKMLPMGLGKQLARVVYSLHGLIVPPESGPARVGWNLGLICIGRHEEAGHNLDRLTEAPEVGPLTCWYASRIFGMFNKDYAVRFAKAGQEKLDEASFRREMEHLLPSESLLVELAGSWSHALRQLDGDEFAQLAIVFGQNVEDPRWTKLISQVRQEQGKPSRETLVDCFVTLWTINLQTRCKSHLEKLAATPLQNPQANYDDLTLDALFPGKKAKDEKPAEKPAKKKVKVFDGALAPLSKP